LQLSSATSFVIIPLDDIIAYDLIAYYSDGFINQTLSLLLSARPSMASASWCNPCAWALRSKDRVWFKNL